jgi:diguanylate cyclase (GGDEF)-like protein/PAS domain S-box-containing protein
MKLATKLALLILASVTLPLLSVGSLVYVTRKHEILQDLKRDIAHVARVTAHDLEDQLTEHHRDLKVVASSSRLRTDAANAAIGLRHYLSAFPNFDALVFVSNDGKLIAYAGTPLLAPDDGSLEQAAASWFREATTGTRIIDRVTPKPGKMDRYLVFASHIDEEWNDYGWVFGQLNSEKIAEISSAARIGETGRVTLFNRNGILIGHPVKERYGYDMSHYPIMRKPVMEGVGDPGGYFTSGDGRDKWGMTLMLDSFPQTQGLHWGIIIDQTIDELNAPIIELRDTILLGATLCGIVFVLLGIWFARRLTAPLDDLQTNLKGFFSYLNQESAAAPPLIKIHGDDEFAQMAEVIDDNIRVTEANIARARELEAAREEALSRLNKIASRLPGVVFQFRLRPDGSSCVPYASDAIQDIYRLRAEEVREDASAVFAVVHPDDLEQHLASIQTSAQDLSPWQDDYRLKFPDGTERWLYGNAMPERETDGSTLWHGFISDITERKHMEDALRMTRASVEAVSDMIFWTASDGRLADVNTAACTALGYTRDELLGMYITDTYLHHSIETWPNIIAKLLETGTITLECYLKHKDGRLIPAECSHNLLVIGDRQFVCSVVRDISERKEVEMQMRQAMVVFNSANQAILTTDAEGVITSVNPAFCTITGYAREDVIGKKPSMFKSGRHDAAFYQAMWGAIMKNGLWEGEIWNQRANGQIFPLWQNITAVRNSLGKTIEYVSLFTDITERKRQEEIIWQQANFDTLTGLANRNLFHDRLERALAQARRSEKKVGLLFLDLDHFKQVNDTLGHDIGDQLLVEAARRLKGCVRDQDTVARMGGDEFTIVVHELSDIDDLRAIGEKAVNLLREPFILAGTAQHISVSIGITLFPDDGENVQTLLKNADIAMYQSKQAGKDCCSFYADPQ